MWWHFAVGIENTLCVLCVQACASSVVASSNSIFPDPQYVKCCIIYKFLNYFSHVLTGYTIASLGPGNGWNCSALAILPFWWFAYAQQWKSFRTLGQYNPHWHPSTCSKHARCPQTFPGGCTPCTYRTPIRLDIYQWIGSNNMPRGAYQEMGEACPRRYRSIKWFGGYPDEHHQFKQYVCPDHQTYRL